MSNNIYSILETIVSRCQVLSLKPFVDDYILSINNRISSFNSDVTIKDFVDYFVLMDEKGNDFLLYSDIYKFKDCLDLFFDLCLHFYFDVLNVFLKRDLVYFSCYNDDIMAMVKNNKIGDIISKIDVINQFMVNVKFNVNKELFIDNFIITMGGVK